MTLGWLRLLRHHERRNGQGLTIPYLVGALRAPLDAVWDNLSEPRDHLKGLILSMRDEMPETHWVRIAECGDLGQPVAYLKSSFYAPSEADLILPAQHGRQSVVLQANYWPDQIQGVESFVDFLWNRLGEPISTGRFSFSRTPRAFQGFDVSERAFIAEALARDEDDEDIRPSRDHLRWRRPV